MQQPASDSGHLPKNRAYWRELRRRYWTRKWIQVKFSFCFLLLFFALLCFVRSFGVVTMCILLVVVTVAAVSCSTRDADLHRFCIGEGIRRNWLLELNKDGECFAVVLCLCEKSVSLR